VIRAKVIRHKRTLTFEGVCCDFGLVADSPSLDTAKVSGAGGTNPFVGWTVLGAAKDNGI
jgi:hypothetical protein